MSASCIDLSASSTILWVPPLMRMVTAFGFLQPSMKTHLSCSTFLSSTRSAYPRSFAVRSSKLLAILAPGRLCELGHVALLRPAHGEDPGLGQIVLGDVVDALLADEDVGPDR